MTTIFGTTKLPVLPTSTKVDIMAMPNHIANLLCHNITNIKHKLIQWWICNTIVLGQETHSTAMAVSLEEEMKELSVVARKGKHEIEQVGQ